MVSGLSELLGSLTVGLYGGTISSSEELNSGILEPFCGEVDFGDESGEILAGLSGENVTPVIVA